MSSKIRNILEEFENNEITIDEAEDKIEEYYEELNDFFHNLDDIKINFPPKETIKYKAVRVENYKTSFKESEDGC